MALRPAMLGATAGCALLAIGSTVGARAAGWAMDAGASALRFTATFESAPAPGRFGRFDVAMHFDPGNPGEGRLVVTVDVASADLGNDDINRAIRGPEWFDSGRFPGAEFRSTRIERTGVTGFIATGTLTIKGIVKSVALPFDWSPSPAGATMTGALSLDRAAFGIGTGEWQSTKQIGGPVAVDFVVRLRRS
jgi:polyisoprenoid-binding protein YceI